MPVRSATYNYIILKQICTMCIFCTIRNRDNKIMRKVTDQKNDK